MVNGETCPDCGSKNVTDNKICYTYDNPSKTYADWVCEDCGCSYGVIYKAEYIEFEKPITEDNGDVNDWEEPERKYL